MNPIASIHKIVISLLVVTCTTFAQATFAVPMEKNFQYCAKVDGERALQYTRKMILDEIDSRAQNDSPFQEHNQSDLFGVDELQPTDLAQNTSG